MSMICNLARVPEHIRIEMHETPERITDLLYPAETEKSAVKIGIFGRLFRKSSKEGASVQKSYRIQEADLLDIDKAWHVLHFLMTGSPWDGEFPGGFLLTSGQPVGDVDVGYGPARSFSASEVELLATYLVGLDKGKLRQGLIPSVLAENKIYPSVWDDEGARDDWGYFEGAFDEIARFVRGAAERHLALLVYLN